MSVTVPRPGNDAGIRRIERTALLYSIGVRFPFKVRPLRKSFLRALNQYTTGDREPFSLCIMEGYWELVEHRFMPEALLNPRGDVGWTRISPQSWNRAHRRRTHGCVR